MPLPSLYAASVILSLSALPVAAAQEQPLVPVPAPADSTEVIGALRDAYNRMTVPVRIGQHGPFDFLIDTGAERTILARDVATRIGLVATAQATLVGVAGSQEVDLVEVDEISLGRRSFYGLTAPLLEGKNIGADGIVGIDSLQDQRVLIDFTKNSIAIGDAAQLGGNREFDIVVKAKRKSGQLIMTNAVIDGVQTDIVLDTGSDSSVGNPALQKALARRSKSERTMLYSVTGQSIGADVSVAKGILIDGMQLNNITLAFADAPAFHRLGMSKRPALLLGMDQLRMFSRVAIDFSTRRVLFDMPVGVAVLDPPRHAF